MVRYAITEIENSEKITASIILVQLLRLSQITSGFATDVSHSEVNFTENPKLDALEDILEDADGKIVIWARFRQDVRNILALCAKLEINAVSIWGEINETDRNNNVRKFQTDEDTRVIVGTAQTGGLGINLTAASTVIYFSNSYSLQDRLQSEDRVHRAGQTNKVTYIDILAKNTIDVGIAKILKSKKNIADIVTKDNLRELL
jgi:SNF2 family DNA or RNA helicase